MVSVSGCVGVCMISGVLSRFFSVLMCLLIVLVLMCSFFVVCFSWFMWVVVLKVSRLLMDGRCSRWWERFMV